MGLSSWLSLKGFMFEENFVVSFAVMTAIIDQPKAVGVSMNFTFGVLTYISVRNPGNQQILHSLQPVGHHPALGHPPRPAGPMSGLLVVDSCYDSAFILVCEASSRWKNQIIHLSR